jgi:hypothetical protein
MKRIIKKWENIKWRYLADCLKAFFMHQSMKNRAFSGKTMQAFSNKRD